MRTSAWLLSLIVLSGCVLDGCALDTEGSLDDISPNSPGGQGGLGGKNAGGSAGNGGKNVGGSAGQNPGGQGGFSGFPTGGTAGDGGKSGDSGQGGAGDGGAGQGGAGASGAGQGGAGDGGAGQGGAGDGGAGQGGAGASGAGQGGAGDGGAGQGGAGTAGQGGAGDGGAGAGGAGNSGNGGAGQGGAGASGAGQGGAGDGGAGQGGAGASGAGTGGAGTGGAGASGAGTGGAGMGGAGASGEGGGGAGGGPTDILLKAALWLDAGQGLQTEKDAGETRIAGWKNLGTIAGSAIAAGNNRPYVGSPLKGTPVVNFKGGQYLRLVGSPDLKASTTFLIARYEQTNNTLIAKHGSEVPGSQDWTLIDAGGQIYFRSGSQNAVTAQSKLNTWLSISGRAQENGLIDLRYNGQSVSKSTGSLETIKGDYIIGAYLNMPSSNQFAYQMTGDIAEVLVFDQALADSDVTSVVTYLGQKWGL